MMERGFYSDLSSSRIHSSGVRVMVLGCARLGNETVSASGTGFIGG